jgi:ABC-type branched-subunit amino acid transport system ATPase component
MSKDGLARRSGGVQREADTLTCSAVSVVYMGLHALRHVTLSIQRGEVVGLIGPNGAGKTTLVNAINGFARISEGSIRLGDLEISDLPPHRRARLGLARTFQHGRLFGDLSVRENVELGALSVGCSAHESGRRADVLLTELGLSALASVSASQLSHGDQQRVSVARAVVAEPGFLLLDEPAAGLPAEALDELGALVEHARAAQGAGVLLIDHNVEFVLGHSERVVVLDHGEVLAEGTPEYVRSHAGVTAAYFGSKATAVPDAGPLRPSDGADGAGGAGEAGGADGTDGAGEAGGAGGPAGPPPRRPRVLPLRGWGSGAAR